MKVLVVGGAGYIGSHCVRQLKELGHSTVILDNLVFGHHAAIPEDCTFYQVDSGDKTALTQILRDEKIEAVMHFAAFAYVGESVKNPLKYYQNNLCKTIQLLESIQEASVKRFVFSSTCATYGIPEKLPITEDSPQKPINPYGQSKLDVENVLKAMAQAYGLSFASLRYFNAAGAAENGNIGEDHDPETHLIPLLMDVALGKREHIEVFGSDYPTPDGSCLRDYVHVDDLARAHIAVLDKLDTSGTALFYNLGTGTPYSVYQVIDAVRKITQHPIPVQKNSRRPGDPPALYANPSKAKRELKWEIQYPSIESIVESAWRWHSKNPRGYPKN